MGFWNRKKSQPADTKVISAHAGDISTMDALERGQSSEADKITHEKLQEYSQNQLKKEQSMPSRDVFTEKSPTSIVPKAIHDPRKDRPESPIRKAKRDIKEKERSEDQLGEEELQTKEKKVLKDIEDVRGSMDENIRKMIEKGERVEAMGNQMEDLAQTSNAFKTETVKAKKNIYWMKWTSYAGAVAIALVVLVLVIIAIKFFL